MKKFPKCEEYGLNVWDNDDLGNIEQEGIDAYDVEQALTQAERTGELTGMRNQHEIEKKDQKIAFEQGKLAGKKELFDEFDFRFGDGMFSKREVLKWLKSQLKEGEKYG